jgi:hypothetical protein
MEMKNLIVGKYIEFVDELENPATLLEKMKELPAYMEGVHPVQIGFLFFHIGRFLMEDIISEVKEEKKMKRKKYRS